MRSWIKMVFCMLAVWGFIKYAPILLMKIKAYRVIVEKSEEMGIDNAALFYSEEPLTSVAEQKLMIRLNQVLKSD